MLKWTCLFLIINIIFAAKLSTKKSKTTDPQQGCIEVWDQCNFSGKSATVCEGGWKRLNTLGLDRNVASFKVGPNTLLVFWRTDVTDGNNAVMINQNVNCLPDNLKNAAISHIQAGVGSI
jgi:hypothetical protein